MTRIDFHVNVDDPIGYTCRLARKVYASRQRLTVHAGNDAMLSVLDTALWAFSPTDFLPHCKSDDRLAIEAPIVLTTAAVPPGRCEILINVDSPSPDFFSRFDRMVEIVGSDEQSLAAGRARWKYYKDRGYELTRHDAGNDSNKASIRDGR